MTGLAWNTNDIRPGVARVRGKWTNALDSAGRWIGFDAAFRENATGFAWTRGPAEYHVGRHLHDGATVVANNRYDIFARQPLTTPAAEFELQPIGGSNVAGQFAPPSALAANYPHVSFATDQSQVWHPEAGGPGLHVRWTIHHGRAPRLTRELVVDPKACPQRDLSLSWDERSPRVLALVRNQSGQLIRPWNGSPGDAADVPATGVSIVSVPDQAAADQIAAEIAAGAISTGLRRGSGIKPPLVWYWTQDGTLVTAPATVRAEIQGDGETVRFTKTIPLAVIQAAAAENSYVVSDDSQTIYSDPNTETTTWDGYITHRNGTFTTALTGTGNAGYSGDSLNIGFVGWSSYSGGRLSRIFMLFDASAISGNTVTAVSHSIYAWANLDAKNYRITGATTASNTGMTMSDYDNTYTNHDVDYITQQQYATQGYRFAEYNAAGIVAVQTAIDGDGIVKTCFREENDFIGSTSATQSADAPHFLLAESADDPYLDVTYGAAASAGPLRSGSLSPGICIRC